MASEAGSPDRSELLWPTLSLRELIDNGDAELQTGPFGTMLHAKAYRNSGVPVVAVKNIGDNRLLDDDIPRVDSDTALRLERYRLLEGDIVFGRKGAVDRRALVKADQEGWLQGSDCIRLRLNRRAINPRFVSFVLGSPFHRAWIIQQAHGATMPSLNQEILSRLPLPVPRIGEQQDIATVLGALDDKIELNRKLNGTLEAMARAIFKSWFVDFDPVRAKAEGRDPGLPDHIAALFPDSFQDSEVGEVPKGWQVKRLVDVCENIFSGGTPSTTVQNYWGGGIPWLSSGETREKFVIGTEKSITERGVKESSTRLARAGATVIASAGQGNTRGQTSMLMFDSYINQSVVALLPDPKQSSDIHLFFDLERRYEEFRRVSDGQSSRGSLTTRLLGGLTVVCPPYEVVRAFDSIAVPIVMRIACALRESRSLAAMRDALLPKLISGEIRLETK